MSFFPVAHLAVVVAALAFAIAIGDAAAAPADPTTDTADLIQPEQRLKNNKVTAALNLGDALFRSDQNRGLEGDKDAALRVAQTYRNVSNGVPRDERQMLQWLLHASSLNNGAASYQLYLYFVEQRLDRDAVFFENRAVEQGYTLPPRVVPRR
jgi:TPR repeat protein